MNVKLLEQVRDYIEAHPKEYNQASWCGTRRCIAGHAVVLAGLIVPLVVTEGEGDPDIQNKVQELAQVALELDDAQAENLFLEWPDRFDDGWGANGRGAAVKACVERINHFISTDGAE